MCPHSRNSMQTLFDERNTDSDMRRLVLSAITNGTFRILFIVTYTHFIYCETRFYLIIMRNACTNLEKEKKV